MILVLLIIATWGMVELTVAWWLAWKSDTWAVTWYFNKWANWWPWADAVLYHAALVFLLVSWDILVWKWRERG